MRQQSPHFPNAAAMNAQVSAAGVEIMPLKSMKKQRSIQHLPGQFPVDDADFDTRSDQEIFTSDSYDAVSDEELGYGYVASKSFRKERKEQGQGKARDASRGRSNGKQEMKIIDPRRSESVMNIPPIGNPNGKPRSHPSPGPSINSLPSQQTFNIRIENTPPSNKESGSERQRQIQLDRERERIEKQAERERDREQDRERYRARDIREIQEGSSHEHQYERSASRMSRRSRGRSSSMHCAHGAGIPIDYRKTGTAGSIPSATTMSRGSSTDHGNDVLYDDEDASSAVYTDLADGSVFSAPQSPSRADPAVETQYPVHSRRLSKTSDRYSQQMAHAEEYEFDDYPHSQYRRPSPAHSDENIVYVKKGNTFVPMITAPQPHTQTHCTSRNPSAFQNPMSPSYREVMPEALYNYYHRPQMKALPPPASAYYENQPSYNFHEAVQQATLAAVKHIQQQSHTQPQMRRRNTVDGRVPLPSEAREAEDWPQSRYPTSFNASRKVPFGEEYPYGDM